MSNDSVVFASFTGESRTWRGQGESIDHLSSGLLTILRLKFKLSVLKISHDSDWSTDVSRVSRMRAGAEADGLERLVMFQSFQTKQRNEGQI